jgi:hypothetical protein
MRRSSCQAPADAHGEEDEGGNGESDALLLAAVLGFLLAGSYVARWQ